MTVEHLKDMIKRLIIDSLVSGESFQCLKCNKEIRRDTTKAEFITPHILIQNEGDYQFLCSTCYNQGKYCPKKEKSFYYRKCANSKCSNRFYISLDEKDSQKYCSDVCTPIKTAESNFETLHLGMPMLWQGQGYALYRYDKDNWCVIVQVKSKIWEVLKLFPASLESVEKIAQLESKVSGKDAKVIQQKITAMIKHTSYHQIIPKKPKRVQKK